MADTYYNLSLTGDQIDQVLENPVLTIPQVLTDAQKQQVRDNIGAGEGGTGAPGCVIVYY